MEYLTIFLIALGLSADSFAVSISAGLSVSNMKFLQGVKIAFVLAFFQASLPAIGWLIGSGLEKYIAKYDHWIAFFLLSGLGIMMIIESFKAEEEKKNFNPLKFLTMLGMGLATSIDALIVGFTLAFVTEKIILTIFVIGAITFLVSMLGMLFGKKISGKFGQRMEIIGGLILIGIGVKTLISHLTV